MHGMMLGITIGGFELLLLVVLTVLVVLVVKLKRWAVAVIAGILVILALTNPSEADHRQAVANSVGASLNPIGRAVVSAAEGLIPLRYNNYILGSSCSIEGRAVSWGFLKNVTVDHR
jgi:hypothetical protein